MNLTPIYELRSRLRTAMIAGTNLIPEDFRLKRAAEEIKPLEALSPVFAKIGQLTATLLAEDCKDRESVLMDVITLVDALLCTQGQVAVTGEIEPVLVDSWGSVITNAPYSIVKTLVESLTISGNGHYQYVLDTHKERPELFQDYRVKSAMVQALGAGYAELAEQVEEWLKEEGSAIVPMLQKDFDPKGKKEMVRRVQVMEAVADTACDDFFIRMLPEAEKDVKMALIYALRHAQENVELLLELVKKEKGNAKKIVQYALACMEDERVEKYFRELYAKRPADILKFIEHSSTKWSAKLVKECMLQLLERCQNPLYGKEANVHTQEEAELLRLALKALPGKCGEEICDVFRAANEVETIFYQVSGKNEIKQWETSTIQRIDQYHYQTSTLPEVMALRLKEAIQRNPEPVLCELAEELYVKEGGNNKRNGYFSAAATARLLGTQDCTKWLQSQLFSESALGAKKNDLCSALVEVLAGVAYDEKTDAYYLKTFVKDETDEQKRCYVHPITQDIAGEFTDLLMRYSDSFVDDELMCFINPNNKELCEKLGNYFYKKAKVVSDGRKYWKGLKKCGFETCEGLLTSYVEKNSGGQGIVSWQLYYTLQELPGTAASLEEEAEALRELVNSKKVKIRNWTEESFNAMVENAKNKREW